MANKTNYWIFPDEGEYVNAPEGWTKKEISMELAKQLERPVDSLSEPFMADDLYAYTDADGDIIYAPFTGTEDEMKTAMLSEGVDVSSLEHMGTSYTATKLKPAMEHLRTQYKGEWGILMDTSEEKISELVINGDIDASTGKKLKKLQVAYRALSGVMDGTFEPSDLGDNGYTPFQNNGYIERALTEAEYGLDLTDEDIDATTMVFPDASRAAKMGDGAVSVGFKGLFDVLEAPVRAGIAGMGAVEGKDFKREMSRPSEYTTGGAQMLKTMVSPTGLITGAGTGAGKLMLKAAVNAPRVAGASKVAKGVNKALDIPVSLAKTLGYTGDAAEVIARGAMDKSILGTGAREMLREAPLAVSEGLRVGTGQEGDNGYLTAGAGLAGGLLQGLGKGTMGKLSKGSDFRTLADEQALKNELSTILAGTPKAQRNKWGTSLDGTEDVESAITKLGDATTAESILRKDIAETMPYERQQMYKDISDEISSKTGVNDQRTAFKEIADVTGVDMHTPFSKEAYEELMAPIKIRLGNASGELSAEGEVLFQNFATRLSQAKTPKQRNSILEAMRSKYGEETVAEVEGLILKTRTPIGKSGMTTEDVMPIGTQNSGTVGDYLEAEEALGLREMGVGFGGKTDIAKPLKMDKAITERTALRQRAGIGQGEAVEATKQGAKSAHDAFKKSMNTELAKTRTGQEILNKYGRIQKISATQADLDDLIKTANKADSQFKQMGASALDRGERGNVFKKYQDLQKEVNKRIKKTFPEHKGDIDFTTPAVMRKVAKFKDFKESAFAGNGWSEKALRASWIGLRKALATSTGAKSTIAILRKYGLDNKVTPEDNVADQGDLNKKHSAMLEGRRQNSFKEPVLSEADKVWKATQDEYYAKPEHAWQRK